MYCMCAMPLSRRPDEERAPLSGKKDSPYGAEEGGDVPLGKQHCQSVPASTVPLQQLRRN